MTKPKTMAITKNEIEHLATLARIRLSDGEADALAGDITGIVAYVGEVSTLAADREGKEKRTGPLFNVMRADEETHEPGAYTDAILNAAPDRNGRYIRVKKVLRNDTDAA